MAVEAGWEGEGRRRRDRSVETSQVEGGRNVGEKRQSEPRELPDRY